MTKLIDSASFEEAIGGSVEVTLGGSTRRLPAARLSDVSVTG